MHHTLVQQVPEHQCALQGSESDALGGQCPVSQLSAPWRLLLLSDGSVTRHLQLLTGVSVQVVSPHYCIAIHGCS